jgi:4-amino-4-deoxy-L-arabinose transferase-like glycosyltransferase
MYIPIAFSVLIFGFNDFAVLLPGFILSMAGIILAYKLTLVFQDNHKTALLAAFFIAIFPLEVFYASTLSLDIPASFFMSLSLYFYIIGFKQENDIDKRRKTLVLFFLTGFTLGISYQIRELGIIIVPFFVLIFTWDVWRQRNSKKFIVLKYVLIASGFLIFIFFELILVFLNTGYPFLRYWYRMGFGPRPEPKSLAVSGTASAIFQETPLERQIRISDLSRYLIYAFTPDYLIGYAFYLFLLSLIWIFLRKKSKIFDPKAVFFSLIWIFYILLYLQFGTQVLSTWILIEKQARFLASISIPLWSINALTIGRFFDFLNKSKGGKILSKRGLDKQYIIFVLIALIFTSNIIFMIEKRDKILYPRPTKEVIFYLKQLPIRPIYCYPRSFALNFEYFFNYKHPAIIAMYWGTEPSHGSYVVISEEIYNDLPFPAWLEQVAWSEWTLLKHMVSSRQSLFLGGFSYNYSSYLFYVP